MLDALAEVVGQAQDKVETQTAPTFLTSISVIGFRGNGRQPGGPFPAPGLMVVSGRMVRENRASPKRWNCTDRHQLPLAQEGDAVGENGEPAPPGPVCHPGRLHRRGHRSVHRRHGLGAGGRVHRAGVLDAGWLRETGRRHDDLGWRVRWNCGARSCPTTNWVGSSRRAVGSL